MKAVFNPMPSLVHSFPVLIDLLYSTKCFHKPFAGGLNAFYSNTRNVLLFLIVSSIQKALLQRNEEGFSLIFYPNPIIVIFCIRFLFIELG